MKSIFGEVTSQYHRKRTQHLCTKARLQTLKSQKKKKRGRITMADFRWIQVSLFVIAVLQFPEAEGLLLSSFTVRAGQEVTLPCVNVIDGQQNCDSTTWVFVNQRAAVELIKLGQIVENSKSDRLSVTQNCSLVIKKLTHEDGGVYDCHQYKSGEIHSWYDVDLFVVTMTEHKIEDQVVLNCSGWTYYELWCVQTVKWLFEGKDVDEDHKDLQTSQYDCSASVTFTTSNSDLLTCEVTDGDKVQLFPFRLQPSGEEPGDDTATKPRPEPTTKTPPPTATATTKPPPTATTKPPTSTATTKTPPTATATTKPPTATATTESSMKSGTINDDSANLKGRKTQMDENMAADDEDDGAVNYENVTSSV